MADRPNTQTHSFDKSLNVDIKDFHDQPNQWSYARNAVNNSITGDYGSLGNEPSNILCTSAPYTIIGTIHVTSDIWLIYSTDNTNSEIGIFKESLCEYTRLVNDPCLNFNMNNLIIGTSRPISTCAFKAYWEDGRRNPGRVIEIVTDPISDNLYTSPNSRIPWITNTVLNGACYIDTNTPNVDCDKLRLAKYIKTPCIKVKKGINGGTLLNGSYMVAVAYAVQGQKVSDWFISNVQGLFNHKNSASSLDVEIYNADETFDEIQVCIISCTNQQTVCRLAGIYSARQNLFSFDTIDPTWVNIPIEQLPLITPIFDSADGMFSVGDYLIRTGPVSKLDFNYQPLANQIRTKWVSAEYPDDYYKKGGNNTNFMRDEVYPFFIRWIWDTGDKTNSYHIPGRPKLISQNENSFITVPQGALKEEVDSGINEKWRCINTATVESLSSYNLPDGGKVVASGYMGYWESSERYPDHKHEIWNASSNTWSQVSNLPYPGSTGAGDDYDLCGKHIRHHKFPEQKTSSLLNYYNPTNNTIRILGVQFENILPPVDMDGNPITTIVGFEILRGSRNGNKSIIAKGIVNNMRRYNSEDNSEYVYFPNYPYNDRRPDNFLSPYKTKWTGSEVKNINGPLQLMNGHSDRFLTFHSPETNFTDPFLSTKELKVYSELKGDVTGQFDISEEHPKEKLITNFAYIISVFAGIGVAASATIGKKDYEYSLPYASGSLTDIQAAAAVGGNPGIQLAILAAYNTYFQANTLGGPLGESLLGVAPGGTGDIPTQTLLAAAAGLTFVPSMVGPKTSFSHEGTDWTNIPSQIRTVLGTPLFTYYFNEGVDSVLRLIQNIVRYRDYALRYHSHCFYKEENSVTYDRYRRTIENAEYLGSELSLFNGDTKINNIFRPRTVAVELIPNQGVPQDISNYALNTTGIEATRILASQVNKLVTFDGHLEKPYGVNFTKNDSYNGITNGTPQVASSYYTALKQRIRNQYGQIGHIKQVPIGCMKTLSEHTKPITSEIIFGGDTYVGRYTEKNTFFFFYDWLYKQLDGEQFDYEERKMLPHPIYWANFEKYESYEYVQSIFGYLGDIFSGNANTSGLQPPSRRHCLDRAYDDQELFANVGLGVKNAWFYLFSSGIRDFYVESEYNLDYRDYNDDIATRHYDELGGFADTKTMFDTKIIKEGNFYKYDQSLSVARLFINYISWGNIQAGIYNPLLADTCFQYIPNRAIYSLPAQYESVRDNWTIFLANNYKDFVSKITCIKSISKNGALILFEHDSPTSFIGVDTLQTTAGTKITIGDGGLFNQPLQALTNADKPFEYASCQNRLSAINTPFGPYWVCQEQGKIFSYAGTMTEISNYGLKWWFAEYLPYKLLEDFPTFDIVDNPVNGVGVQALYDNTNNIVFFAKRDFKLRTDINDKVEYIGDSMFLVNDLVRIHLGDVLYFEDASWTMSFDPKTSAWVSYHDWHPNLTIPGKDNFYTTKGPNIWEHNKVCDSYCNFYGINYPFEIEHITDTAQQVNTLRSIEYQMEVYTYANNCLDRYHQLDFNFDEAIIYNSEQVSGTLELVLSPKNDPMTILNYPIVHPNRFEILYSKEEQKYRFNQFYDITADRGEFNPNAQRVIWNTESNGYIRTLNQNNLNYSKPSFQHKKFRHYNTKVLLKRKISGSNKMLVRLVNNKNLTSTR